MNKPVIHHSALDFGLHEFEFHLNNDFFKDFDYDDFLNCSIDVAVTLQKEETLMTVTMNCNGFVVTQCDRCLSDLQLNVNTSDSFIVKFEEGENEEENIMYISDDESIDLSQSLFDLIIMSLPVRKVHPDDENGNSTCAPEQLRFLEQYEKHDTIDPRWEALKNLKEE